MRIHEYQAKEIFARYGIAVPENRLAASGEEAWKATADLDGRAVLKAQIHAGGRGHGGGVKVVNSPDEARQVADALLAERLVTPQTGPEGAPVYHVLVEALADIARELYLAITIDRVARSPVLLASPAGGMDIEEVAATRPQDIHNEVIDPVMGFMPFQARRLTAKLGLEGAQAQACAGVMGNLCRIFADNDCSLVEINPLVVTGGGDLVALDAKINLDDDSLFRHRDLLKLQDKSQEDELEVRAADMDIAYVNLDGEVGCLVNGAGLAMATLDVANAAGAAPANFLDVGGGATDEKVANAVSIILSDPKVTRVLVNIFGGILRCDVAARGVVQAYRQMGSDLPLVVRLLGTNAEEGRSILRDSGLQVTFANTLSEAAHAIRQSR
jgi:succinyl-CoA synthetase beta subunit